MILADTSVWIDHFRKSDSQLALLLNQAQILAHPLIVGEIALGNLKNRRQVLFDLRELPEANPASDDEVLAFIEAAKLAGSGISYIDAHLLASVRLTPDAKIWTRDKKLKAAAEAIGLGLVETWAEPQAATLSVSLQRWGTSP
jgi:predicted nucleic acid-binding protein